MSCHSLVAYIDKTEGVSHLIFIILVLLSLSVSRNRDAGVSTHDITLCLLLRAPFRVHYNAYES